MSSICSRRASRLMTILATTAGSLLFTAVAMAGNAAASEPRALAPAVDDNKTVVDHAHHAMTPAADVPGESLFQLPVHFTTAGGEPLVLDDYRGAPLVVTMFYGTCKAACPLLARAMTATAQALPPASRDKVRFLMVTLDPQRDTIEELQRFAREYRLDAPRYAVARTDADGVRLLAAALGIRYRTLPDGMISHSSILTALDADGVPRARTERLAEADPQFVSDVATLAR